MMKHTCCKLHVAQIGATSASIVCVHASTDRRGRISASRSAHKLISFVHCLVWTMSIESLSNCLSSEQMKFVSLNSHALPWADMHLRMKTQPGMWLLRSLDKEMLQYLHDDVCNLCTVAQLQQSELGASGTALVHATSAAVAQSHWLEEHRTHM